MNFITAEAGGYLLSRDLAVIRRVYKSVQEGEKENGA